MGHTAASKRNRRDKVLKEYSNVLMTHRTYGDYRLVDYETADKVDIEFINTGYKSTVAFSSFKKGAVRDKTVPRTSCGRQETQVSKVNGLFKGSWIDNINGQRAKVMCLYDLNEIKLQWEINDRITTATEAQIASGKFYTDVTDIASIRWIKPNAVYESHINTR